MKNIIIAISYIIIAISWIILPIADNIIHDAHIVFPIVSANRLIIALAITNALAFGAACVVVPE
jgi:hypothetical protein